MLWPERPQAWRQDACGLPAPSRPLPRAPWSMGFSRQGYWGELPFLPPGDLPPGIESRAPALQADSLLFEPPGKPKDATSSGPRCPVWAWSAQAFAVGCGRGQRSLLFLPLSGSAPRAQSPGGPAFLLITVFDGEMPPEEWLRRRHLRLEGRTRRGRRAGKAWEGVFFEGFLGLWGLEVKWVWNLGRGRSTRSQPASPRGSFAPEFFWDFQGSVTIHRLFLQGISVYQAPLVLWGKWNWKQDSPFAGLLLSSFYFPLWCFTRVSFIIIITIPRSRKWQPSTLAWKIPRTEKPGGLQAVESYYYLFIFCISS